MAASMYIVVEGDDPGFDTFVNGRALARNEDPLEHLAIQLGVKPLIDFFSADDNAMALLLDQGAGDADLQGKLLPPQWFSGQEGLVTVSAMLDALRDDPGVLGSEGEFIREELEEYETVLRKAADRNLRWHLAVSFR
jgi:hypothetical protein